jgi:hypothetical protein
MQVQQYRKKPVVIEAMIYTDNNGKEVAKWCDGRFIAKAVNSTGVWDETLTIKTLEGVMKANVGDYIIKGVKGEFYPCKPDIFEATYEKV